MTPRIPAEADVPPEAARVRVHLRSFDVDDPAPYLPDKDGDTAPDAVEDNRGTPGAGTLADEWLDVPAGETTASTTFTVSLQPGDNYRVAASTSDEWLASLHARQTVAPSAPVQDGALSESGPNISPMLTVWRTLHLEIDSMAAPPDESTPPTAPEYAERNFIKGRVLRIHVRGPVLPPAPDDKPLLIEPRYIYVEAEPTTPELLLQDGSVHLPYAGGRFHKGRIRFGSGNEAVVVDPLDGNGFDSGVTKWEYVRAISAPPDPPRIAIPYELSRATLRTARGRVLAWDSLTRVFTLDVPVSTQYQGGRLRVAGLDWTVAAISGTEVTVVEDQAIPFVLTDDDPVVTSFPISSVYLTDSDQPVDNVLALAYIRPRADLVGAVTPPFLRNVPRSAAAREAQLAAGREWTSTPPFWVSYIQGASQANTVWDADPDTESSYLGLTEGFDDRHGSFVFVTAINDKTHCPRPDELDHTFAHELGHHFGLGDQSGGIMNWAEPPACVLPPDWFTAAQLAAIRSKGVAP